MAREYKNDTLKQMTRYFTRPLTQSSDFELFAGIIVTLENCTLEQAKDWISSLQTQMGEAFEQSIIFVAELPESKVLGAVLLRPTPNGFYELFGGVHKQFNRAELSIALLKAAQVKGGKIYTFASENYWDTTILESLGFEEVAQYQRLGNLHFNSTQYQKTSPILASRVGVKVQKIVPITCEWVFYCSSQRQLWLGAHQNNYPNMLMSIVR